jgi:hypothetical protein
MSRMVGGSSTNKDCDERLLVSFLMSRMVGGSSTNMGKDELLISGIFFPKVKRLEIQLF